MSKRAAGSGDGDDDLREIMVPGGGGSGLREAVAKAKRRRVELTGPELPPVNTLDAKWLRDEPRCPELPPWNSLVEASVGSREAVFTLGELHPTMLVEAPALAAVMPKPLLGTELPDLPENVPALGKLSAIQLETVALAVRSLDQRIETKPPARGGYLLGDGTGFGKGRVISATMLHFWRRGAKRHLWLSASPELIADATRDLRDVTLGGAPDLGKNSLPVMSLKDWPLDDDERAFTWEGVVFSSYSLLSRDVRRVRQLCAWLQGSNGAVVALDEAHKARNMETKTGQRVQALTRRVPDAGVIYVSATIASRAEHFAFMPRLGLWSVPKSGFSQFWSFAEFVNNGGVPAMELLAMDCKRRGMASCRMLTLEGMEFETETCSTTQKFRQQHEAACAFIAELRAIVVTLLESPQIRKTKFGKAKPKLACWMQFWGGVSRFCRQMLLCGKIPACVELARQSVKAGNAVVISLWSTGGTVAGANTDADTVETVGPRRALEKLLQSEKIFQTRAAKTHRPLPWAEKLVEDAKAKLALLDLPGNPLEDLMTGLGGPRAVAEMTGRGGRGARANANERVSFQAGKKHIAVISEAGSVGFSLHAAARPDGRQELPRRRHLLALELPFTAEKVIQAFGRVHRVGQVSTPQFNILVSDFMSEQRFVGGVSKRVSALSAMSRGSKGSLARGTFDAFDLSHSLAKQAIQRFMFAITNAAAEHDGAQSDSDDSNRGGAGDDQPEDDDLKSLPSDEDEAGDGEDDGGEKRVGRLSSDDTFILCQKFLKLQKSNDCPAETFQEFASMTKKLLEGVGFVHHSDIDDKLTGAQAPGECNAVTIFLNRMLVIPFLMQNCILSLIAALCHALSANASASTTSGIASLNVPPLLRWASAPPRPLRIVSRRRLAVRPEAIELVAVVIAVDNRLLWDDAVVLLGAFTGSFFVRPKRDGKGPLCLLCLPRDPQTFVVFQPHGEPYVQSAAHVGKKVQCGEAEARKRWGQTLAREDALPQVTLLCGDVLACGPRLCDLFDKPKLMLKRAALEGDPPIVGALLPSKSSVGQVEARLGDGAMSEDEGQSSGEDSDLTFASAEKGPAGAELEVSLIESGGDSDSAASSSSSSDSSSSSSSSSDSDAVIAID